MRKHILTHRGHVHVGCPVCTIVPSHMLRHLAQHGPDNLRERMLQTLQHSERLRGQRDMLAYLGAVALAASFLPARRARSIDPMAVLRDA